MRPRCYIDVAFSLSLQLLKASDDEESKKHIEEIESA